VLGGGGPALRGGGRGSELQHAAGAEDAHHQAIRLRPGEAAAILPRGSIVSNFFFLRGSELQHAAGAEDSHHQALSLRPRQQ
jgi:cytochrome c-type biogenesis protein CcmH/NrfG